MYTWCCWLCEHLCVKVSYWSYGYKQRRGSWACFKSEQIKKVIYWINVVAAVVKKLFIFYFVIAEYFCRCMYMWLLVPIIGTLPKFMIDGFDALNSHFSNFWPKLQSKPIHQKWWINSYRRWWDPELNHNKWKGNKHKTLVLTANLFLNCHDRHSSPCQSAIKHNWLFFKFPVCKPSWPGHDTVHPAVLFVVALCQGGQATERKRNNLRAQLKLPNLQVNKSSCARAQSHSRPGTNV